MEVESRVYGVEGFGEKIGLGSWPESACAGPEQGLDKSLSNDWVSTWHSPVGYFVYSCGELTGKNLSSRCYDHSVEDRGEAG